MFKFLNGSFSPNYKGLRIMANPDLHSSVLGFIRSLKIDLNSDVLVLGAGTGAFDQRLLDFGFNNITSVDINFENYQVSDEKIKFVSADLNENFAAILDKKFDIIICLEVIEHVYSPFHLIQGCNKLLKTDGRILVSTPNVHDGVSRVHNLLFGYPTLFLSRPDKFDHVSPIFKRILEHYLDLNNLKLERTVQISSFFKYITIYSYKSYLYYFLLLSFFVLLSPVLFFSMEKMNGLITLFCIKKA